MLLSGSKRNAVVGNTISGNTYGIWCEYSSSNFIIGNTVIHSNQCGIWLSKSNSSRIYNNNFVDNMLQMSVLKSFNFLNNSFEGNYWSDYNGSDSNNDGIGDLPKTVDANNRDNYPLMGIFSDFKATSECHAQTICNSSISNFRFNGTAITFDVSGGNGTTGFCRICIPTALMKGTYRVFVNGTEVSCNLLSCSNSTYSYLYFNYTHSTQQVIIVPEFPSFLILPIFMIATLLAIIVRRRKRPSSIRRTSLKPD
jgi:parallel beta-helix repeat protein